MLSRNISRSLDETIALSGLIGYWHYAQGVNGSIWQNIAPNTKGLYNGIFNGGVALLSDGINFDGTTSYVDIGAFSPLNGLSSFTYQLLLSAPYDNNFRIALGLYSSDSYYYGVGYNNNKQPYYNDSVSHFGFAGFGTNITTDFLLTVTVDSTGRYIYADSSLNNSYSMPSTLMSINKMIFGAQQNSDSTRIQYFKGKIKAIRIYNRALTISEIAQNLKIGNSVGL